MRVRDFVFFALALVLLISGCNSKPTAVDEQATSEEPTVEYAVESISVTPNPASPSGVEAAMQHIRRVEGTPLVRVDGEEIFWEEYEPSLVQVLKDVSQQGAIDWNDPAMTKRLGYLQNEALEQVVDRCLVRQLALERNLNVSDELIEGELQKVKDKVSSEARYADWDSYLSANGYTENSIRQVTRDTFLLMGLIQVQEVDTQSEQVHLAHVAVNDEATAQEVYDRLNAGVSFEQVAAEYSIDDQTKDDGGDLGWFSYDGMLPELLSAARSVEVGQFSAPIPTRSGYIIIKILGREMRDVEASQLMLRKQQAMMSQLDARRAAAQIEYLVDFTSEESSP